MPAFETSALNKFNVDNAFLDLILQIASPKQAASNDAVRRSQSMASVGRARSSSTASLTNPPQLPTQPAPNVARSASSTSVTRSANTGGGGGGGNSSRREGSSDARASATSMSRSPSAPSNLDQRPKRDASQSRGGERRGSTVPNPAATKQQNKKGGCAIL